MEEKKRRRKKRSVNVVDNMLCKYSRPLVNRQIMRLERERERERERRREGGVKQRITNQKKRMTNFLSNTSEYCSYQCWTLIQKMRHYQTLCVCVLQKSQSLIQSLSIVCMSLCVSNNTTLIQCALTIKYLISKRLERKKKSFFEKEKPE